MKTLGIVAIGLALAPLLAAQESPPTAPARSPAQGYANFGGSSSAGDFTNLLAMGGGGEGFVYRSIAVGGDAAYLFPARRFLGGLGLVSANGSYHFTGLGDGRLAPFVTGGYSLAFREGAVNMANFGGGVTYWFRPGLGVRFEVRDHHHSDFSIVTFRIGLSFR
jgi:hypothetical protein